MGTSRELHHGQVAQSEADMTDKDPDKEYLERLKDVDDKVQQRLNDEFSQLRTIALVVVALALLFVVGSRFIG